MNSLEAEYSFLAPTWKLPAMATPSMYPSIYETGELTPSPKPATEMSTWNHNNNNNNNNMHNPRYIPPNANRRTYPPPTNQQQGGNGYPSQTYQYTNDHYRNNDNEELDTLPPVRQNNHSDYRPANQPPIQKRVQIMDHNRQTPSTDYVSGRDSQESHHTSDHNVTKPKLKGRRDHTDDNKSESGRSSLPRPSHFNIHEYLYGLSAPDPGSYVNAYRNHQRRVQDERMDHRSMMTEYKTFVKNGGFGPAFNNSNHQTYQERLESEKKRQSYSKTVREVNRYKVEEHKRVQNNGGEQRNRTYAALPLPRLRRPDELRSHFLSPKELPIGRASPRRASFDHLHPWNETDVLSGELSVDQSYSIISLSPLIHRRRSSTFVNLPRSLTPSNRTGCFRKSSVVKDFLIPRNFAYLDDPTVCQTFSTSKRKFITPHSMKKSDMQSSPAVCLKTVNQPLKSEITNMATVSTALPKKPILIIRSPENSSKPIARTVRFEPEIIVNTLDDDNDDNQMTQRKSPSSTTKKPISTKNDSSDD